MRALIISHKYFSFLLLLILWQSCSKNTVPEKDNSCFYCEYESSYDNIDTLWSDKLQGEDGVTYKGIYLDGDIVIYIGELNNYTFIYGYDKKTGERLWENKFIEYFVFYAVQKNSLLILQDFLNIWAHDVITGLRKHTFEPPNDGTLYLKGNLLGDHFYHSRYKTGDSTTYVVRSHVLDFESWETIYSLNLENSNYHIRGMNLWIHPESGDSILIMKQLLSLGKQVDIAAWNINKGKYLWRHNDLSPLEAGTSHQILLRDNKAYLSTRSKFLCLDMNTGDIIWQFNHPSGNHSISQFRPIFAKNENAIILKDDLSGLFAIDINTGNLQWKHVNLGEYSSSSGSPVYHDGIIYYISENKLWAVSASSGEVILIQEGASENNQGFRGDVAVDQETGILYTSSAKHVFAIRGVEK